MRIQPTRKHYTKAERVFVRTLQELRIKFSSKVKIGGREIDFVIGNYAIEIDGHEQSEEKNRMLIELGYNAIHYNNKEVINNIANIKKWLEQIYSLT